MKVIVIGGGAAGSMAAINAAGSGADVTLIEKNEKIGKKIYITGKGRCNVTNSSDADVFFKNVNRNSKFLYSSFYNFDNFSVIRFFEDHGCPLKEERGNRVFPVSDHSSDIIKTLTNVLKESGVKILFNTCVKDLIVEEGVVKGVILSDEKKLFSDRVIVATGGVSYPMTGSDGDGYRFAKETGHDLKEPEASLIPIVPKEDFYKELQGLSLKNVKLTLFDNNKKIYEEMGEMMFAHFGLTGPLILTASTKMTFKDKSKSHEYKLLLDLKPALSKEMLDERLLKDFGKNINKAFKNSLDELLPKNLIPVMIELSGIDPMKQVNEITREERREFVELMKNVSFTPVALRPISEAIITKGGVSVKDINPSTMESKKIKNLYFAGEVIDVDAMTGGFNLQIAWSTGFLAGTI